MIEHAREMAENRPLDHVRDQDRIRLGRPMLLEEVIDERDSTWTFVADVVLELAHHGTTGTSAAEERVITVRKNRFGPAHVGPHAFAIHQERGIEIYPRLSAYLSLTARKYLPHVVRQGTWPQWRLFRQGSQGQGGQLVIPKVGEVVLVTGENATFVSGTLDRLVLGTPILRLDMASAAPSEKMILRFGDPLLGPERMISDVCSKLKELSGAISGLVVGDLEAINHNIDPSGLRRALPVLIMIAQSAGLPIALFETALQYTLLSTHLADTIIRTDHHLPLGAGLKLSSRSQNIIDLNVVLP